MPLFRGFPETVPQDTWSLYTRRVLSWVLQQPEQPCLLCGRMGTVSALDPCGHLVCSACWDGADYSGCPICHRRISQSDPFLRPPRRAEPGESEGVSLKLLHLGQDLEAATKELLGRLLGRASPLSPRDRDALGTLIETLRQRVLPWLPERIPVKETMAFVFGTLLRDTGSIDEGLRAAEPHLRTATDVLRVLCVWMGGAANLMEPPKRFRSPPRALRRGVLAVLERFDTNLLLEDMGRHAELWKRMGEQLHPFEQHARFPNAALAFAVLRRTEVDPTSALGKSLLSVAKRPPRCVHLEGKRLRFSSWATGLEQSLRTGQLEAALGQLRQRPGELLRRLDHLLREIVHERPALLGTFLEALDASLGRVSPAVLLTVLAHLRVRARPLPRRVFFPRGEVAHAYTLPDKRPLLSADAIAPVVDRLERELLRRAEGPSLSQAVLDAGLEDLFVPFNERTAARALVAVPRGSSLPIPKGRRLRLFVHWMEPLRRYVDLDLSVSLYDASWRYRGKCDFSRLRYGEDAAVHSGDLTSAPPPLGASEFVDLDLDALEARGVRHLVVIIFSFNDVSFDQLPEAFAGFMLRGASGGEHFDARTVEQRFDLQGNAKIAVPMLVDLKTRRTQWVDVNMPTSGLYHQVGGYRAALAHLGLDLTAYYDSGARMTLWELACLHAAARTPRVYVRRRDGQVALYRRGADEPVLSFFHRLRQGAGEPVLSFFQRLVRRPEPDHEQVPHVPESTEPVFLAVLRDDVPAPAGSLGYALNWRELSPERVHRLTASELVAELKRD